MRRDPNHPIWDVHDLRRTARLTVKYFCARLATLERQNFWTEIVLAATAAGSAIAGLAFWSTTVGHVLWQILTVAAAVLAVAKPLLKYGDRMQRLDEIVASWRSVEHDLQKIEIVARQRGKYDQRLQERFGEVLERMDAIVVKPTEHHTDAKLRLRCQEMVQQELPAERFYVPEEPNA